jgi:hypothetical protein
VGQVGIRRAIVESLVQSTCDEAALRSKRVKTIDPIMKVGRRMYPFLSDRELVDYASTALRIILNSKEFPFYQTTLIAS